MTSIAPVSRNELTQRRQQLRSRRRTQFFQASWRNLAVICLAGVAIWGLTLPAWVLQKPEQITIKGNRILSAAALRSLLPITYPQSLLKIQPQALAEALKAKGVVAEATVDRQLLPPGLTVTVRERLPIALTSPTDAVTGSQRSTSTEFAQLGLLDESGAWISLERYTALNRNFKLPTLKVTGNPAYYRSDWPQLYPLIQQSPVKIFEVNWDNPANVILKTELGLVHLGPYHAKLAEQLQLLDRLRRLPNRVQPHQVAYIDLTRLDSPTIQINPPKSPVK